MREGLKRRKEHRFPEGELRHRKTMAPSSSRGWSQVPVL